MDQTETTAAQSPDWLGALTESCLSINDAAARLARAALAHDRPATEHALSAVLAATRSMRARAGVAATGTTPHAPEHEGPGAVVAATLGALRAIADEASELAVLGLSLRLDRLRGDEQTDPAQALVQSLDSIDSWTLGLARTLSMDPSTPATRTTPQKNQEQR